MPLKRALHDLVERPWADAARVAFFDRRAQRSDIPAISVDQGFNVRARTFEAADAYSGIDVGAQIIGQGNTNMAHAEDDMRNGRRVNPAIAISDPS